MAYDFHGDWERVAGHNSPLFQRSSESSADLEKNVVSKINYSIVHVLKTCFLER
jgi:GH18 family chitinase